eukprot:SAG31_NODE_17349_length_674_cov_1.064348_1_plen_214_part_10
MRRLWTQIALKFEIDIRDPGRIVFNHSGERQQLPPRSFGNFLQFDDDRAGDFSETESELSSATSGSTSCYSNSRDGEFPIAESACQHTTTAAAAIDVGVASKKVCRLYKTQMCRQFSLTGKCSHPHCTFAHGEHELRPVIATATATETAMAPAPAPALATPAPAPAPALAPATSASAIEVSVAQITRSSVPRRASCVLSTSTLVVSTNPFSALS